MWWIFFSATLIYIFYLALVSKFIIGWRSMTAFVLKGDEIVTTKISVVIACRNEEKNVRKLISCLAQQSIQDFELIFVNDHSDDATRNYIKAAQLLFPKIKLLDALGTGKKNAIKEGILSSTGELIVTTDADCLPSYHWLESIACYYQKYKTDLIICPVKLVGKDNLFHKLQILEFTALVASGAGAAGAGMPVLCNGANLAFKKSIWLKSQADLHEEQLSGDDMFLLESIKKKKGSIRFLKSESAYVTTKPTATLGGFIKQRRRWTSKSPAYTDWQIISTACIVLSINLLCLIMLSFSMMNSDCLMIFLSLFLFKYIVDTVFLYSVRTFYQLNNVWFYSLLLSFLYPFYVVIVTLSSLVIKTKTWK